VSIGALPGSSPRQVAAWTWSIVAWLALIALGIAWELVFAPLRPGGSWLVLKVVPLLLPLPAMLRGSAYAMQLALFVSLLAVFEGAARLFEPLPGAMLAALELLLAVAFFVAAVVYLRPMKIASKRERSA
jgi:uncharacterized membrane protein